MQTIKIILKSFVFWFIQLEKKNQLKNFSGWNEDKSENAIGSFQTRLNELQLLYDGYGIGQCFARASLRSDVAVLAVQNAWNGFLLDLSHLQ